MAGENGEAEDPLCVSEAAASQKKLVRVHRYTLARGQYEVTIELVQEFIGLFTFNLHIDQLVE